MFILTEKKIIRMLRSEYRQRLLEVVNETDVFDDRGNMIIGKDLKVRHKKSQYEYTVDDVLEDPKTGDVQIALRMPEDPRIAPEPPAEEIISDTNKILCVAGAGSGKTTVLTKRIEFLVKYRNVSTRCTRS